MNILLVRHGETVWKTEGKTHGQLDSPLTHRGVEQVRALANELLSERFELVLSSPLGRALQSAKILSSELGIPDLHTDERLTEQGEGAFEGLTREEQRERYPVCFDPEGRVLQDSVPGGESSLAFRRRVVEALREIGSLAKSSDVLVVTHTGVMQVAAELSSERHGDASRRSFGFCETLILRPTQISSS